MPIVERTPEACFDRSRTHVARLLAAIIPSEHYVRCDRREGTLLATIAFWRGDEATTIALDTRFGRLHFYLAQLLEVVRDKPREYRLCTRRYWYRLQEKPGRQEQAMLRWEYDSALAADQKNPCRHHVQAPAAVSIAGRPLDLNKAHIPTGWVTMEEVLRFLIVELGVKPRCGDHWPATLATSERVFFEEFTSKRYRQ